MTSQAVTVFFAFSIYLKSMIKYAFSGKTTSVPALDFIAVKYLLFTSSVITAQPAVSVTREQSFSRSVIVCTAFIFPFVIQSVNSHVV